jgi:hypothetical protein
MYRMKVGDEKMITFPTIFGASATPNADVWQ